mgnify:CR=1 FL=1
MHLWLRGIPSRRPSRFSSAPLSSALASDARSTIVFCRWQSRTFLAGRYGSLPRLPRTADRTAPLHGAGTLPRYCQNNPYSFSFPASSSSFPVAQQKQPVFIKMFKKQAKKKEPLSGPKGKILSLYDFSLFFWCTCPIFCRNKQKHMEISGISQFLMCFGLFRTDMLGS